MASNTSKDIARLAMQGYCCSQIMVLLALEAMEDENPQLVDAMRGLCGGLHSGMTCGVLTGAACLLSMVNPNAAKDHLVARLVEWFHMSFSECYGGINCAQIIDNNPKNNFERCPRIMELTFDKCRELLSETGKAL